MQETVSGTQMLLGLGIGIFVLVFLILKTKVHAFLALIIAAALPSPASSAACRRPPLSNPSPPGSATPSAASAS
jgi:hypothetical protein